MIFGPTGSGAAGSVQACTTVTNANYTVLTTDEYIEVTTGNTDRTITLLDPTTNANKICRIKKVDSGTGVVKVVPAGSQNVEYNVQTYYIINQYDEVTFVATGSIYRIIGAYLPRKLQSPVEINLLDPETAFINDSAGVWTAYADAAGTSPVDGTGGSPTVNAPLSTTNPLTGYTSLNYVKDAANRQGEGISALFACPPAFYATVLTIEFDYIVVSGTFAAGAGTTASDVTVWIYDVTNSTVIPVTPASLMSSSTSVPGHFKGTFQTSATGASYRLCIHVGSTSASAYTLKLDNFRVGPTPAIYGAAVTDMTAYTATHAWTSNVTHTTMWRRVGDCLEGQCISVLSGAPTSAALYYTLPAGLTIDTTKLPLLSGNDGTPTVGIGTASDDSANIQVMLRVITNNSTTVAVMYEDDAAAGVGLTAVTQAAPFTFASGDGVFVTFRVPITGWSSTVQMSNDADTRVVAARYDISASTGNLSIASAGTEVVDFDTKIIDTHDAVTTGASWVFTCPVPGTYRISANVNLLSVADAKIITLYANKNGSIENMLGRIGSSVSEQYSPSGSCLVRLVAGDTVSVSISNGDSSARNVDTTAKRNSIHIERLSGPSAIAASETVSISYYNTAGTSFTGGGGATDVPFATKVNDSHGAFSTPTFTAPTSGIYMVDCGIYSQAVTYSGTQSTTLTLVHNSTGHLLDQKYGNASSNAQALRGHKQIRMLAGDTIKMQLDADVTTSLNTTAHRNFLTICRIGNY